MAQSRAPLPASTEPAQNGATSPPLVFSASDDALGQPQTPGTRKPSLARRIARLWPALVLGIAVLAVWQLAKMFGSVPDIFLPAPLAVARSFWLALTDGTFVTYGVVTLQESMLGFALGALIALPAGYLIARSDVVARALEPYLAASQAVPAVALAPLLVLWLGYGILPVAALCALIVFFPSAVTTTLGIRALDRDVLDAARVDGADRWALLRSMEFPLALPSILAGLRASLTLSITGAVVGEFVVTDQGLGGLLNIARGAYDGALEFATLIILMLFAMILYLLIRAIERSVSYLEAM